MTHRVRAQRVVAETAGAVGVLGERLQRGQCGTEKGTKGDGA